ncbi:MAG: PaaI family thioesterase [Alphaproteobacteria bacterium]|jgi:acyl-coenzyme A thioesterase PaaI-like protein|nr:PaaI family thioesterase [Alphaproteobacteria bacterium]
MPETSDDQTPHVIPAGFELSKSRGPFTTHNGPTYRASAKGDMRSGLLVLDRHCNSMGFLHGGMASAFADGALAWAVWHETRRMSVTLKLTLSFLDIVRAGAWLEARPGIDAVHDELVHVHADLVTGSHKAARAEAVFRLLRRRPGRESGR